MNPNATGSATILLRALAVIQGCGIVALGTLLLRSSEVAPAPATPQTAAAPAGVHEPALAVAPSPPSPAPQSAATPASAAMAAGETPNAPEGTVLYGRVTNEAGEAIPDCSVWLSRAGETTQIASLHLSQRDPAFAIAGLAAGKLTYKTRAAGYKEQADTIDIPAGTRHLRHDIVLSQAWLMTVKILTPEGQPLHVALQEASKARPMLHHVQVSAIVTAGRPEGDFPPTALREADIGLGRWRSGSGIEARMRGGPQQPKDVAGTIEIDGKQSVWVSAVLRHHVLASVAVEPGQAEVTLTIALAQVLKDLGTIRGRVVEAATGKPATKARIGFGDLQSSGQGNLVDENGRFEVQDLRPGLLDVEIMGEKQHALRDLILLKPGQALDLGDLPVFEFRTIKGRCEGITGKAESCRVSYTPLTPPPHPAMRRYAESASVAADGSFQLYLPDGRYRLRASGAGGAITEIDTTTLGDGPLVLQLAQEASIRLDVQTNGEPWELALFDSTGQAVFRRDLKNGWKFAMPFLPGDYRVELKDASGKVHTRQLHLGVDGADLRVP